MFIEIKNFFVSNFLGQFILTFFTLHTIHWFSIVLYFNYCVDISLWGYFTNIMNHGPLCHILLSTSYYAQTNIYTIIGASSIISGLNYLTNKLIKIDKNL